MGLTKFLVPPERLSVDAVNQAYMASVDGVPWVSSVRLVDEILFVEKPTSESGKLFFPWALPDGSWLTVHSATLPESSEPYSLTVELARGFLAELREFLWEVSLAWLPLPDSIEESVRELSREFYRLACHPAPEAQRAAALDWFIQKGVQIGGEVCRLVVQELLDLRLRAGRRLPTLLGICLNDWAPGSLLEEQLRAGFTAGMVPLVWRQIEPREWQRDWTRTDRQIQWCRQAGWAVLAGPLISFSPQYFPLFLEAYAGDWEAIRDTALEFVRAVVDRYRTKVHAWICGARMNTGDVLILSEEERIELAAAVATLVQELDSSTPVFLSIDQPLGEYLSRRPSKYPPLLLAQALIHSQIPISGFHLEIAWGYYPGSVRRDLVQFARALDWWAELDIPLLVTLTVPSSGDVDKKALLAGRMVQPGATPASQADWAGKLVELLLSRPYVHGVFWGQLGDHFPHEYPHGGLFDQEALPKPALKTLGEIKRKWLS
ncbi:MAG: hypothetical protein NZ899_11475 [Thermoguttaceae bacterium]|nr:hypothetical protein [Thermoguttaceae bacterium]MDW8079538.1 hypothetical protein [Thermoguttaceae bacterium]